MLSVFSNLNLLPSRDPPLNGEGIKELVKLIDAGRSSKAKDESVILREKERIRREILEVLKSKDDIIEMFAKKVVSDDLTREEAVLEVLKKILK